MKAWLRNIGPAIGYPGGGGASRAPPCSLCNRNRHDTPWRQYLSKRPCTFNL